MERGVSQIGNGPAAPRTDAEYEGLIRAKLQDVHAKTVLAKDPNYTALQDRVGDVAKDRRSLTPVPQGDQQRQAQKNYDSALDTQRGVGEAVAQAAQTKADAPVEAKRVEAESRERIEGAKQEGANQRTDARVKGATEQNQSRIDAKAEAQEKALTSKEKMGTLSLKEKRDLAGIRAATQIVTGGRFTDDAARDSAAKFVKEHFVAEHLVGGNKIFEMDDGTWLDPKTNTKYNVVKGVYQPIPETAPKEK